MLLINEIKEYKVVNGSIKIVKEILFEHRGGPRHILYQIATCVNIELKKYVWRKNEMAN